METPLVLCNPHSNNPDPGSSAIEKLPTELVEDITTYLGVTDLAALRLSGSRQLNAQVQQQFGKRFFHTRRIRVFEYCSPSFQSFLALTESSELAQYICILYIDEESYCLHSTRSYLGPHENRVTQAFNRLSSLRSLYLHKRHHRRQSYTQDYFSVTWVFMYLNKILGSHSQIQELYGGCIYPDSILELPNLLNSTRLQILELRLAIETDISNGNTAQKSWTRAAALVSALPASRSLQLSFQGKNTVHQTLGGMWSISFQSPVRFSWGHIHSPKTAVHFETLLRMFKNTQQAITAIEFSDIILIGAGVSWVKVLEAIIRLPNLNFVFLQNLSQASCRCRMYNIPSYIAAHALTFEGENLMRELQQFMKVMIEYHRQVDGFRTHNCGMNW